jgi:hypothetical protein
LNIGHLGLNLIGFTEVVGQTWPTIIVDVGTESGKEDDLAIEVCGAGVAIGRSGILDGWCSVIEMTKSGGVVIVIGGFANRREGAGW